MIDRDELHAVLMRAGTPVHVADAWVEELMLAHHEHEARMARMRAEFKARVATMRREFDATLAALRRELAALQEPA
jgi:hypothetical protein